MSSLYELSTDVDKLLGSDKYSELTMTYTQEGFEELKSNIKSNGQLVPILLRDGKILDGRHRYKACVELKIPVACIEVGLIDDDKAIGMVINNAVHKSTSSDAAKVEAYVMCKAKGIKKISMPNAFSRLNNNYVKKLGFIERENPEYLTVLLHQNKVRLYSAEFDKVEDYGTINGLWRVIKGNHKYGSKVVEIVPEPEDAKQYTVDLEEYFSNPFAETEYWDLFSIAKEGGSNLHPGTALGKKVAGLIKYKYSRSTK